MELSVELLEHTLSQIRTDFIKDMEQIMELRCYQALEQIRAVLADNSLDDPECFHRIEEIICIFEKMGSACGTRHDFG